MTAFFATRQRQMPEIDFAELSHALEDAGTGADAAECHATLTGLICAGPALPGDWMEKVTGGGDTIDGIKPVLTQLEAQTRRDLGGGEMKFDLFLPQDGVSLTDRTQSLAHWCQGFVYGLTVGGIPVDRPLPGEVGEVVRDFSTLSQATHEGEAEEDDERAYVELCEYVRVGAQLVYEELQGKRA
ncbi:MAG: UPF0149 family protein [Gammaproteobacteria bacterium]|nr:UPF0149 family protein [Gammaproteobacteria bacterium]